MPDATVNAIPMRAVSFNLSIPRYVLGRAVGRVWDGAVFGVPSGLRLRDMPTPELPGPSWVELEVLACGICGTDVANLTFQASPILEPFASFPAVLGHEIVARVVRTGAAVTRVEAGERVVVDPLLSCTARGYDLAEQCTSCAVGMAALCAHSGERGRLEVRGTALAPGITIGYHRDLPGGWGERMIAHETQLFPVDDALDDRAAALIEPLSIGMRAVLRSPPGPGDSVLVIGSGAIALSTIWALRALGHGNPVLAQIKRAHEAALATRLGATNVVTPGDRARGALLDTGATAYRPMMNPEVYAGGGFSVIYDCVGSRHSVDQSLRYAAPRGRIVMLGCAAVLPRIDLTLLWARELSVQGYVGYGLETWHGETLHTFAITQRLLRDGDQAVADMVTHTFPLDHYRTALATARHHRRSGAIKVLFTPPTGSSRR